MKDVNTILRQKIYDLLITAVSPVPVYAYYLPATINTPEYITINTIANTDVSTMHSSDTETAVQISIFTKQSQANPGNHINTIAAAIYAALYPDQQTVLNLAPEFQNIGIKMVNDNVTEAIATQNFVFINRFITFRFKIVHT
jgi:hypothetical protein